jgi:hypothetical protein
LHQTEVVSVVPDLGDLPILEPEDVDAREPDAPTSRFDVPPRSEVGTGRRPPADDVVAFGDDQIDVELEIGKGRAEVASDLLLSLGTRKRICRPEIVAHVVGCEYLIGGGEFPLCPDLTISALFSASAISCKCGCSGC